MDITGKIIAVLPERTGKSARTGNDWVCGQYVLETQEQYPKRMYFEIFGSDKIQQFNLQVGELVTVSFDIDAREYNGRWFNSIRAFKVERPQQQAYAGGEVPPVTPMPQTAPAGLTSGAPFDNPGTADDLPF